MITLGIESTAHTLSIGIVKDGNVLSNIIDMYYAGNEGLIPRKLADHHSEVFAKVLSQALSSALLNMKKIDLISFSQGPGIGAPLSVGVAGAKYLAIRYKKPIIGVNHPYAHVKISEHSTKLNNPLVLYVSGGNTQILVERNGHYIVLGETLDIGIGNLFDSFARAIKLKHAHGSALEALAKGGKYVELPYTVKGLNLVFSGLLTKSEQLSVRTDIPHKDLAYSLMETAFSMTCEVAERALFLTNKKSLIVCGGVAQNKRLQQMLRLMCKEAGVNFGVAPDEFNRDNGAMIAYAGELLYKKYGGMVIEDCDPMTNYRIDQMNFVFRS
ncbi:tRNA (adenosine(37)-N6)-threonylcarbamoyltransferase complex transferase subunit TsaD [Candidatus Micrarchaeota archaeon]|nr:tRNA (adenosine(37)-N6)-threonylcarbamoyltransferase complex transferase subunit TsaD [Candidatus Micrarchaeota archaeon]